MKRLVKYLRRYALGGPIKTRSLPNGEILSFLLHTTKTRASSVRFRIALIAAEVLPNAVVTVERKGRRPKTRASLVDWQLVVREARSREQEEDVCLL